MGTREKQQLSSVIHAGAYWDSYDLLRPVAAGQPFKSNENNVYQYPFPCPEVWDASCQRIAGMAAWLSARFHELPWW